MKITGTIVKVELSGGFWGIKGDDGIEYAPVMGIPEMFHQEGLRIEAEVEKPEMFSIYMWGEPVMVSQISKI